MTIHRVFRLLDVQPQPAPHIDQLVETLLGSFHVAIVTTNWDIMAERCLERLGQPFFYTQQPDSRFPERTRLGVPLWKLHGSGNWGYCDVAAR